MTVLQQEKADPPIMRQALLDALAGLRDLHTQDIEAYTRAILYLFLLILHRREADEHQDLLRILTQEHTQNQEIVNMAGSIIELSEQRGEQTRHSTRYSARHRTRHRTRIAPNEYRKHTRYPSTPDSLTLTLTHSHQPLEIIEDLNRLKQLNLEASLVESFGAFQECLEA